MNMIYDGAYRVTSDNFVVFVSDREERTTSNPQRHLQPTVPQVISLVSGPPPLLR